DDRGRDRADRRRHRRRVRRRGRSEHPQGGRPPLPGARCHPHRGIQRVLRRPPVGGGGLRDSGGASHETIRQAAAARRVGQHRRVRVSGHEGRPAPHRCAAGGAAAGCDPARWARGARGAGWAGWASKAGPRRRVPRMSSPRPAAVAAPVRETTPTAPLAAAGPLLAAVSRHALLARRLLAFGAGALLACAFAPFEWWPLAILCPAVLMGLWEDAAPREAAWTGFCFSFGTFLAGTYWLYVSVHDLGKAPVWLTIAIMLGLIGIMALYNALIGYAAARWLPRSGAFRWLLGMPAAWLLIEWWRGWFLSGFSW